MDSRLLLYYDKVPLTYVAVCQYGFGIDRDPAKAILLAQEHVGLDDPVSQMLLYSAYIEWDDEEDIIKPIGWKNDGPIWADGSKPKLRALLNTHQGYVRRPR